MTSQLLAGDQPRSQHFLVIALKGFTRRIAPGLLQERVQPSVLGIPQVNNRFGQRIETGLNFLMELDAVRRTEPGDVGPVGPEIIRCEIFDYSMCWGSFCASETRENADKKTRTKRIEVLLIHIEFDWVQLYYWAFLFFGDIDLPGLPNLEGLVPKM